jgi:hypothetical protein
MTPIHSPESLARSRSATSGADGGTRHRRDIAGDAQAQVVVVALPGQDRRHPPGRAVSA